MEENLTGFFPLCQMHCKNDKFLCKTVKLDILYQKVIICCTDNLWEFTLSDVSMRGHAAIGIMSDVVHMAFGV